MSDKPKCDPGFKPVQFDGQWHCIPANITNKLEDLLRQSGAAEQFIHEAQTKFKQVAHDQFLQIDQDAGEYRAHVRRHDE